MSAASALQAARDAGIGLHVDGVDLVLEASESHSKPWGLKTGAKGHDEEQGKEGQ